MQVSTDVLTGCFSVLTGCFISTPPQRIVAPTWPLCKTHQFSCVNIENTGISVVDFGGQTRSDTDGMRADDGGWS